MSLYSVQCFIPWPLHGSCQIRGVGKSSFSKQPSRGIVWQRFPTTSEDTRSHAWCNTNNAHWLANSLCKKNWLILGYRWWRAMWAIFRTRGRLAGCGIPLKMRHTELILDQEKAHEAPSRVWHHTNNAHWLVDSGIPLMTRHVSYF